MGKRLFGALASIVLVACGDDGMAMGDADVDAVADAGTYFDIPWLAEGAPPIDPPALTPCPPGWREVSDDFAAHCEPFPETGVAACPNGQAHFVGEPGCMPVGAPCPSGDFAEGLPSDSSVLYVRGGATGGDGSLSAPFGSLSEVGFGGLATGTTVALARGTYPGTLPLRAGVRVVGACTAETFVTGIAGPAAVVTLESAGEPAELSNLTVLRPPQSAVRVTRPGGVLRLRGVIIDGATNFALGMAAGELDAEEIVVRETREVSSTESGIGVSCLGGSVRIARAVFENNHYAAIYATGAGTEVSVSDTYVHDTRPDGVSGTYGYALSGRDGALVDVSRAYFASNRTGVSAASPETVVQVQDVVVRDTYRDDERVAFALLARDGGRIEGNRVFLHDNDDVGISALEGDASLSLSDVVVRDVRAPEGTTAKGLGVQATNGRIELTRSLVEHTNVHGILLNTGARATLVDLVVRDVLPRPGDELFGRGLALQYGATASVERALFEQASEVSVLAGDPGSALTLTDVAIRDTRARPTRGDLGRGLVAQLDARVTGTRVLIARNVETGVLAMNGADVVLSEALVSDTTSNLCDTGPCRDTPFGYGVAVLRSGSIDLSRFSIRDSEVCGLFIGPDSTIDLSGGEVRRATIGACVQNPMFDLSSLMNGVAYTENMTNLESTSLPVPDEIPEI